MWAVGIACVHGTGGADAFPFPGLVSAETAGACCPFPRPPGSSYWVYFWAYPGAKPYWSLVAATGVLAAVLFKAGRRRAAPSPLPPTGSPDPEQDTLLKA